jgi:hypothetical protein
MAHGGLTSLPVHNFNPDNYAHGGIVAFGPGGLTDAEVRNRIIDASPTDAASADAPLDPRLLADQDAPVDTSGAAMLTRALENLQAARTKMPSRTLQAIRDEQTGVEEAELKKLGIGALGADRTKKLEELAKQDPERKSEALRNFLMSAGFNMAAEASQYGRPQSGGLLGSLLQPAALGASKALPGYLADQKELRSLTAARDKELAEITDRRRTEALSGVRTSQGTKDKEDARIERMDEKILAGEIELAKSKVTSETARLGRTPTDLTIVAKNYLQAQRDLKDTRSDAVIMREGIDKHIRDKARYDPTYAGQQSVANTAAASVAERYANQAQDSIDRALNDPGSNEARELSKLRKPKADTETEAQYRARQERADNYRDEKIQRRARELKRAAESVSGAQSSSAPAAAPAAGRQRRVDPPLGFVEQ